MKQLVKKLNISKAEWRFVSLLILIIILITALPYLYANFSAKPDKIYNGLHILTPGDIHVYFSYLEQVKQKKYLFQNLFTGEITKPTLNIFWLTIGLLGKFLNLNNILTFQLARILLIPICIASAYLLISYFFDLKQTESEPVESRLQRQTSAENNIRSATSRNLLLRKITLIFLLFSSGVGAIASIFLPAYISNRTLFYWPMDLWVPEHNLFLTLYHSPHLIASLTLIILIFLFFLKAIDDNKTKYSVYAGLCGLLLIQFHPFHLPTIWLIPSIYIISKHLISKKQYCNPIINNQQPTTINYNGLNPLRAFSGQNWTSSPATGELLKFHDNKFNNIKHILILITVSSPSALYYLWLTKTDWATNLKAIQNVCRTPRFFVVLISYGGLLIGCVAAILLFVKYLIPDIKFLNRQPIANHKLLFLIVWTIAQFALIFLPFPFQRRLTEGLQIPLVFLTISGALWLKNFLKKKYQRLELIFFNKYVLIIAFLIYFTMSNWVLIIEDFKHFTNNYEKFYYDKQQIESYRWLKDNTTANDIILSNMPNGNFIPGVSGRHVYFGHVNVETLFYDEKLANLKWFFKNNSDGDKINFLIKNNIKYIYYSKYERGLGGFNPNNKNYLKKIYSNNFAKIYKIIKKSKLKQ